METLKEKDTITFITKKSNTTLHYRVCWGGHKDGEDCYYLMETDMFSNDEIFKSILEVVTSCNKDMYCEKIVGKGNIRGGCDFPEIKGLKGLTKVLESFFPYCTSVTVNGVEVCSSNVIVRSHSRIKIDLA